MALIQLYNLEGQPVEQWDDSKPIPSGRWTSPDGGAKWQNGGVDQAGQIVGSATSAPATNAPASGLSSTGAAAAAGQTLPWQQLVNQAKANPAQNTTQTAAPTSAFGNVTPNQVTSTGTTTSGSVPVVSNTTTQSSANVSPATPSSTLTSGTATVGNTAPTSGVVNGAFNAQAYVNTHPEFKEEYLWYTSDPERLQGIKNIHGSVENWVATKALAGGSPEEKSAATQWQAANPNLLPGGATGGTTNSGGSTSPGVSTGGLNLPALVVPPTTGNYAQGSSGAQGGAYQSTGITDQTQTGKKNETSQQNQTQQSSTNVSGATTGTQNTTGTSTQSQVGTTAQNQTGTSTQQQTGQQQTTGATTGSTRVATPFDITSLVGAQLPETAKTDAATRAWLGDFLQTGGQGFQSQVDKAVRQSISGPQMTGAGDSAQARAAGYAAADVARNNAAQRLQAAGQLMSPTGLTQSAGQLSPLYGTDTSGTTTGNATTSGTTTGSTTGTTTGTSANTTTGATAQNTTSAQQNNQTTNQTLTDQINKVANTLDFQSLVGKETQSGTASGTSASQGAGTVPQGQAVKTGGCVVCTAYLALGQMKPGAIRRAVKWKAGLRHYAISVDGYMLYGPALARLTLKNGLFARWFKPIARAILYHEVYLSAPTRLQWRAIPCITHAVFDYASRPVGLISRLLRLNTGVRCPQVRELLKSQKLEFKLS